MSDSVNDDSMSDLITDDNADAKRGRLGGLGIATAIVFGLFYSYALWSALARQVDPAPLWLAALGVAVPIVVFVLALWLGIRRNLGEKALIYIAGLLVVAALTFSLISFGIPTVVAT